MTNEWDTFDWESWTPCEEATLLFVIDAATNRVLLIHKKRGLGTGKINGPGGRLEQGETPVQAAIRETEEEVGVRVDAPEFCGTLRFHFLDGYRLLGHVFKAAQWHGEPVETDEALPEWFPTDAVPYDRMWTDDKYWFPHMLAGRAFAGRFIFDGDAMLWHCVETTD